MVAWLSKNKTVKCSVTDIFIIKDSVMIVIFKNSIFVCRSDQSVTFRYVMHMNIVKKNT